ncbi:MAG: hypothetical protein FWF00_03180 [Endomicrobia bacterium]|nr:hypothetical protein [Endomicrobiia bacterium]MCL2506679.1 hypothetical protein [Endomicrobiia bacterium]
MRIKEKQLVYKDDYGKEHFEDWKREIKYFTENIISSEIYSYTGRPFKLEKFRLDKRSNEIFSIEFDLEYLSLGYSFKESIGYCCEEAYDFIESIFDEVANMSFVDEDGKLYKAEDSDIVINKSMRRN